MGGRGLAIFLRVLNASQPRGDGLAANLAAGGAGQVGLGPEHPAADALKIVQALVGALDGRRSLVAASVHGQHRAGLRAACRLHRHHGAGRDLRLLLDGRLEILGMKVDTRRGDDDFALAPEEAQLASGRALGQVARGQPLVRARAQLAAGPRGRGDRLAAHQHFAIGPQLDLASRQRLADAAASHMEGMVERDQRRGFRHAVALHDDKTQGIPKLLGRCRQRAAAGDQRPELEAEGGVNVAEDPPAARHAYLLL